MNLSSLQSNHKDLSDKLADFFYISANTKPRVSCNRQWYTKLCRLAKCALLEEIKNGTCSSIREARAYYKKIIIEAKHEWETDRWENIRSALDNHGLRAFWNLVKHGEVEGSAAIDPNLSEAVWCLHFKNLYSNDLEVISSDSFSSLEPLSGLSDPSTSNFSAPLCNLKEVMVVLDGLLPEKAPGLDKIPGDLYHSERKVWAPYLEVLFNALLLGMEIPQTWLRAEIIPIFKKGSPIRTSELSPY